MDRNELKEKIAEAIATGMLEPEGIDWSYIKSTPDHPIYECCSKHAESGLSAIEQSGCEINQTGTQAELELLEEVCAIYTRDEDRYLREQSEPYGLIPTECGMKARSAAKRFYDRTQGKTEDG